MFTDLFGKPIDRYQYLCFQSAYPNQTKRSVASSEIWYISRLCSNNSYYEQNKEKN